MLENSSKYTAMLCEASRECGSSGEIPIVAEKFPEARTCST